MDENSTLKIVPPAPEKPPDDSLPPGSLLNHGKYRVECVLGRGGFGVTYLALDCTLGLRVAVKECLPKSAAWRNASGEPVQWGLSAPEQDAMLENFVREARKMAKIDQIPGVVRVREYFYDNSTAYIVMDYVDGETLTQRLARTGPMSAEECFGLLSPVMDALALAHGRGLVHRDISPNNIMIEKSGGKVWLLDLGAAKDMGKRAFAPNVSNGTQIIGTPGYTPLEQYDPDGKIGPWTDIYALSATFVRCMTGQTPPPSTSRAMKDEIPELLRPAPGKVGAALRKGLAQNPEERYQNITELRDALEKAFPKKKNVKTKEQNSKPQTSPEKKAVLVMVTLLVALIAAFTVIPFMTHSTPTTEPQNADALQTTEEPASSEVEQSANVISGECGDNAVWTFYNDLGRLTISGTGNMEDYGDRFSGNEPPWADYKNSIYSVEILDGMTKIGNYAFYQFYALQYVDIPDSIIAIGECAFCSCSSLSKVTIPDNVTKIDTYAFLACSSLTALNIPNGVTEIGKGAFGDCSSLTNITIPDSVTVIPGGAFEECTALTRISIPDSVTEIGDMAFSKCSNLTSAAIPDSVTKIGYYAFQGCTALTAINIPDGVTKIESATFGECSSLTNVAIPGSVLEIGASSFDSCTSLKNVVISEGVTLVREYAFGGCTALESVAFPNSMYRIAEFAFVGCSSLSSVTIPDSVAAIEEGAFRGCTSLASVSVPEGTLLTNAFDENTTVTRR